MGITDYNNDEYKVIRDKIEDLYYEDKNFDLCFEETKKFLRFIKNNKANRYNLYWTYSMFSKLYNKMGNKRATFDNLLKAEKFLDKKVSILWINLKWQLGMYYKDLNDKKALNYFQQAFKESHEIDNYEYMGGLLDEIALIEKDIDLMLDAIDKYKNADIKEQTKNNGLDEMYAHLFQLYIEKNKEIEAYRTLHKIKNKILANELNNEVKLKLNVCKLA